MIEVTEKYGFRLKSFGIVEVFDADKRIGICEKVYDDWVFHPDNCGCAAFGCTPGDAVEQWEVRNRGGRYED